MAERGLKQLPDKRWQYSWMFEGRYHRKIARTKTEARRALESIRTKIAEGRYMDKRQEQHTPFEQACKRFLEWGKSHLRESTFVGDVHLVKLWKPHFGGKSLDRIRPDEIENYRTQRVENTSKRTADYDLSRLRRLFSLSIKWGLCKDNPAKKVDLFHADRRKDRFISESEEALLFQYLDPRIAGHVLFLLNTGLRTGELASLTWENVDLRRGPFGYVTVTADKSKSKKTRHVPLTESARKVLDSLPRSIRSEDFVFSRLNGRNDGLLKKAFKKAVEKAKLKEVSLHTLRHTYASRLVMAGVDLPTVKELMGHSSIQTTMRYAHLSRPHLEEAVSKLRKSCDWKNATQQAEGA